MDEGGEGWIERENFWDVLGREVEGSGCRGWGGTGDGQNDVNDKKI